jgi:hypothetical protein
LYGGQANAVGKRFAFPKVPNICLGGYLDQMEAVAADGAQKRHVLMANQRRRPAAGLQHEGVLGEGDGSEKRGDCLKNN